MDTSYTPSAMFSNLPVPTNRFGERHNPPRQMNALGLTLPLEDEQPELASGDSARSPSSPISPAFGSNFSYQLPIEDNWLASGDESNISPCTASFPTSVSLDGLNIPMATVVDQNGTPAYLQTSPNLAGYLPAGNRKMMPPNLGVTDNSPSMAQEGHSMGFSYISRKPQDTPAHPAAVEDGDTKASPRKRKSASSTAVSSCRSSVSPPPLPPTKKTSHNMIEKRYRTNLNDKIAALRDAVPSLRVMVHRLEQQNDVGGMEDEVETEDLGGLAPAHKLNKATILSKATEYIAHLERRNSMLELDNTQLRSEVGDSGQMHVSAGESADRLGWMKSDVAFTRS